MSKNFRALEICGKARCSGMGKIRVGKFGDLKRSMNHIGSSAFSMRIIARFTHSYNLRAISQPLYRDFKEL